MLEVAANHLLFDSISTKFDVLSDGDATGSKNSTTVTTKDEESLSTTPIELTVEIQSPRFFFEGLKTISCSDAASSPQQGLDGKLIFRAKGKLRGDNFSSWPGSACNDTDSCLTPEMEVCRNSKDTSRIGVNSLFENIEIEIDCEALLSQMMEEASKVVTMAVELTNLAWTNNTQKQEEINNMKMVADETRRTANIIVDDDEVSHSKQRTRSRMTGKRSRNEDNPDPQAGTRMLKQVSEFSFCPPAQVVRDEETVEESQVSDTPSPSRTTATITNLHVLEQDADRKTRYFNVSDPSYDSSSVATDHDYCPHQEDHNGDECCNMITAERACDIVDFVLAGDTIPLHFSPNKKLRTK